LGRFGSHFAGEYKRYPGNVVSNAKYNAITFIPVVLYEEVGAKVYGS